MDHIDQTLANWPKPPTNPAEALAHTVAMYADAADGDMVIIATSNIYGQGIRTGLTWSDLRAILASQETQ